MKPVTSKELPLDILQRILDAQGYVVYGYDKPVPMGHIFEDVAVCPVTGKARAAKTVVIGIATGDDLYRQQRTFYPQPWNRKKSVWPYHYKVTAE